MTTLTLYTTAGCHLCDLADVILQALASQYQLTIVATEIGDDDQLVERYGIRIPVVRFADNSEIGWPFDQHDIENKLMQQ
jgi:glutaredoxin